MALRREKVDGIWNPVGAYDIRNFFSTPQMLVVLYKEEIRWRRTSFYPYINQSKDSWPRCARGSSVWHLCRRLGAGERRLELKAPQPMLGRWALPVLPRTPTPLRTWCIQLSPCFSAEEPSPAGLAQLVPTWGEEVWIGVKVTLTCGRTVPLGHRG